MDGTIYHTQDPEAPYTGEGGGKTRLLNVHDLALIHHPGGVDPSHQSVIEDTMTGVGI